MKNHFDWLSVPLKAANDLQNIITSIMNLITWGNSTFQSLLSLEDIENWFYSLPSSVRKKIDRGVVFYLDDASDGKIRVFQAVLNNKWRPIKAREIVVNEISSELEKLIGDNDMVIFSENPELF